MSAEQLIVALGLYAGTLALMLLAYWLYGKVADWLHARRMAAKFDAFAKAQKGADGGHHEHR